MRWSNWFMRDYEWTFLFAGFPMGEDIYPRAWPE